MKALKHLFLFLFIATTFISYACSCIGTSTVKSGLKYSDVVFMGTVIKAQKITETDSVQILDKKIAVSYSYYIYTLKVEKKYKRKRKRYLRDTIVKIRTGLGGGDCGYPFVKGKKYIIYSRKQKNYKHLTTNICTRTRLYDKKEIEELDKLTD